MVESLERVYNGRLLGKILSIRYGIAAAAAADMETSQKNRGK